MSRAWKFGDNINTDQIIPGRYYPRENVEELGEFCLSELDPGFAQNKQPGDVIVAGKNFGCGSSREYAPIALKHSKVQCVIASSFARIFYRNCINIGFPILICESCYDEIAQGDAIEVDLALGIIKDITTGKEYRSEPLPPFAIDIVSAGGILNYIKEHNIGGL
jgi:3-isopropylmalate/(R)-2-methylmalate dehydratase small subunit